MAQPLTYAELMTEVQELKKAIQLKDNELQLKTEEIDFLKQKLFGRSKETVTVPDNQLSLFEGLPDHTEEPELPEEETVTYTRKKQKGKKRKVLEQFEEVPIVHDLDDKQCEVCHHELHPIGRTKVREELVYQPATMERHVHYAKTYKCECCSKTEANDQMVKAFVPLAPIRNSYGSASIIAETLHQKYDLKVPGYRQVKDWERMGLPISRQHIAHWHIQSAQYYFYAIFQALIHHLQDQTVVHADETSYRVIESSKQTNYYWLFQSGEWEDKQMALFHFDESRRHEVPQLFLGDFKGYLHSDMYPAYQSLEGATIVGCFAHLRRKFFEAMPAQDTSQSLAQKWVRLCDQCFKLEADWQTLSPEERLERRQAELAPLLDRLFQELATYASHAGKGKLGKAIHYALKHEQYFRNVLKDGRLALSNNRAERSIKELVMGRKNWLFSSSLKGAQASGIILSLKVTAELNGLSPKNYFQLLLEELPTRYHLRKMDDLEAYLPWSQYVQERCQ